MPNTCSYCYTNCNTPTPHPIIEFNNTGAGLRENNINNILEYVFGIIDNENGFEYGMYFFGGFFFYFSQKIIRCSV